MAARSTPDAAPNPILDTTNRSARLDWTPRAGNNAGMGGIMRRLLVLVCAVELALPTSWCCSADAGGLPGDDDSLPVKAPACCWCCPSFESEASSPQSPESLPPAPQSTCCCNPQQASLQKDVPVDNSADRVSWQMLPTNSRLAQSLLWPVRLGPFQEPPLYLLHSVWLC